MKITNVAAQNLKGRSFSLALGPVTLLMGPSFSGKTAVLDAVRLALLGYHPQLGKRPLDTWKLSNGQTMHVDLETVDFDKDKGMDISRSWASEMERQKEVIRMKGPDKMFVPPAMLDCREYFGMTGPERMKYVFDRVDAGKDLGEAAVATRIRTLRPESAGDHVEAAIGEALGIVANLAQAQREEDATAQEFIAAVLEKFTLFRKGAADAAKQYEGLAQGSAQLKAGAGQAPARPVESELAEAREMTTKHRIELEQLKAANIESFKRQARLDWLRSSLAGMPDNTAEIDKLWREINTIAALLKAPAPNVDEAIKLMLGIKSEMDRGKSELARLTNEAAELADKHADDLKMKCCPWCKSKGAGWKDAKIAEFEAQSAALKKAIVNVRKTNNGRAENYAAAKAAYEEVAGKVEARAAAQQSMNEKRNELDGLLEAAKAREQYRMEREALEKTAPPPEDQDRMGWLVECIQRGEGIVAELEAAQRRFVAAKAEEAQLLKAKAAHGAQKARAEVFKLAAEAIRDLQQATINKAISSLMDVANKFTEDILAGPLEYRDGDIGYKAGDTWVTHECFSGTEQGLAYAGLAVALAQQSPFKLVMIDELGIVDKETKWKILRRMVALWRAGTIDQFIGADVANPEMGHAPDGITLIDIK